MVVDVFHELEVATKLMALVFCVIFAVYFWRHRQGAEMKETRLVLLGQGLFVLCFGLTRGIFIVADYFSPAIFAINPNLVIIVDADLYYLLWIISSAIGILAIIFLLVVIETYLVKSRYFFTITATVCLIIVLIPINQDFARLMTYITLPIAMIGVIALYAYLFFKAKGEIRKKASLSIDGFILFGVGVVLDTSFGKNLLRSWGVNLPAFIPVIIMIVGLAIYTYGNIKD